MAGLRLDRLIVRPPDSAGAGASGASARAVQLALVDTLRRALEGERVRGRAGHWSFDANRCIGLERAYREACAELERLCGRAP